MVVVVVVVVVVSPLSTTFLFLLNGICRYDVVDADCLVCLMLLFIFIYWSLRYIGHIPCRVL